MTLILKDAALWGLACGVVTMAIALALLLASQALQAASAAELHGPHLSFGFSPV
jgi:hypothetical protein